MTKNTLFQPSPSQTFYSENISSNPPPPLSLSLTTNWKRSNRKRTLTPLATPPSTTPAPVSSPTHDGWVALVVFREAAHSTPGYICRSTRSTASPSGEVS